MRNCRCIATEKGSFREHRPRDQQIYNEVEAGDIPHCIFFMKLMDPDG